MTHDNDAIPEGKGYDVAELQTQNGDHVGYVSILPMSPPAGALLTGGGSRCFVLVKQNVPASRPLLYREVYAFVPLGPIRDTVADCAQDAEGDDA